MATPIFPSTPAGSPGLRVSSVHVSPPSVVLKIALPALATVARAEDAALRIGAVRVTERRDVHVVGIARIDADRRDVACLAEADVRPGPAAVGRLVYAVAVRDV